MAATRKERRLVSIPDFRRAALSLPAKVLAAKLQG
jgi:hypothetical protein